MKYLPFLLFLSLPTFAVPISGEPPTQRVDGTAFDVTTELQSFKVYCGIQQGNYTDSWEFAGYQLPRTTWDVPLASGVHYCAVTTIDKDRRESIYSNEVVIIINPPNPPIITYPASADFNADGVVNGLDVGIFKTYFGE